MNTADHLSLEHLQAARRRMIEQQNRPRRLVFTVPHAWTHNADLIAIVKETMVGRGCDVIWPERCAGCLPWE